MKKILNSITSSWKTTILGIIAFALTMLVTFSDLIDRAQANALEEIASALIDNIEIIYGLILAAIGVVSRDGDKSSEDSKIK